MSVHFYLHARRPKLLKFANAALSASTLNVGMTGAGLGTIGAYTFAGRQQRVADPSSQAAEESENAGVLEKGWLRKQARVFDMLIGFIIRIFDIAQSYFDLMQRCDVCTHTGVLIPRRPDDDGVAPAPKSLSPIRISVAEFEQQVLTADLAGVRR
jgi:hypothetical protein